MNGTKIQELAEVNGVLNAMKASFNRLNVNGNFQGQEVAITEGKINGNTVLVKSKVSGIITIYGLLKANESEFSGKIVVDSSETFISNSKIQDILILNSSEKSIVQKIYLMDNTIVKGSIVFQSGKGEVIISNSPTISKSQVVGGKITLKQ
jgi:hypothetical protein